MTWPPRSRRIRLLIASALAVAGVASVWYLAITQPSAPAPSRQQEVAARGQQVMPFDLDRTTHTFTTLDTGGRQTVTADDPKDSEQIRLIREHLRHEADAFAQGDLRDPVTIHGPQMPGVAELSAGGARIAITYQDVPAGAELTYATTEPALISAIHAWFGAQVSDHGPHAQHG